jgi:hypothetical protein
MHCEYINYVPVLEYFLTTRYDGPVNSLECLTEVVRGNNDISKLLDLGAMAYMTLFSPHGSWHTLWRCNVPLNGRKKLYLMWYAKTLTEKRLVYR